MTAESSRAREKYQSDIPIVCTLSEDDMTRRRDGVLADLTAHAGEVNELADGYELRFPGTPEWVAKLTQFITDERACCAFFTFELVFEPEQGPVWLRIRGSDGVKSFLREMLQPVDA